MSDELLVEVTRNGTVESRHFGTAVVCNYKGDILADWGDINKLIFPRSALKPMLAIHLLESGASEHYALSNAELAIACASHQGEKMHRRLIASWLQRIGLTETNLACGATLPEHTQSAHKLVATGQQGCRIHHNCSGKHTALLTTAMHLKMCLNNYHLLDHPSQQLSLEILSSLADIDLKQFPIGIDGCGLPAPIMPLRHLGLAAARFAKPIDFPNFRAKAIYRLQEAMLSDSFYVAGHGSVVSDLIQITNGKVLAKNGAEGVFTASLPQQGWGIALKIADGGNRAAPVALLAILDHLGALSDAEKHELQAHIFPKLVNSRGLDIGQIRPASSWLP